MLPIPGVLTLKAFPYLPGEMNAFNVLFNACVCVLCVFVCFEENRSRLVYVCVCIHVEMYVCVFACVRVCALLSCLFVYVKHR